MQRSNTVKLKSYWFFGVTVSCAIPLAAMIFHGLHDNTQTQRQELAFERSLVSGVGIKLRDRLINAEKVISLAADFMGNTGTKDPKILQAFLKNLYTTYNEFLNVHYDSLDGKVLAFYPPIGPDGKSNIGVDHTNRKHWRALQENNTAHVSEIFQGVGATSKVIANVTSGAFDASGRLVGYAVSALDLEFLARQFSDMKLPKGYILAVTDGAGQTVFSTSSQLALKSSLLDENQLREIKKTEDGVWTNVKDVNGGLLSGLVCDIPQIGWYIGLLHEPLNSFPRFKNQYAAGLFSLLLGILLSSCISYLTYRPVGNALKRLMDQTKKPDSDPVEKINSPEEFGIFQKALMKGTAKIAGEEINRENEEKKERLLMMKYIKLFDVNQALAESMTLEKLGFLVVNDYGIVEDINPTFNEITGYSLLKGGNCDFKLIEELRKATLKNSAKQNFALFTFPLTGIQACCRLISIGKDPTRSLFTVRRVSTPTKPATAKCNEEGFD